MYPHAPVHVAYLCTLDRNLVYEHSKTSDSQRPKVLDQQHASVYNARLFAATLTFPSGFPWSNSDDTCHILGAAIRLLLPEAHSESHSWLAADAFYVVRAASRRVTRDVVRDAAGA